MSGNFRPMKSTEKNVTRLDNIYPGLRIIEKYHPPGKGYPDASAELIAGIKKGGSVNLNKKGPIK